MIDQSQTVCYIFFGMLCLIISIIYLKIKSTEGIIITTQEFKLFQSNYIIGYNIMIFGELLSISSFFHSFIYLELSVYDITKLYVITTISTTIFSIIIEIFDISNRKNKCILSAILYFISLSSIFFGHNYEMLMMGRIVYG